MENYIRDAIKPFIDRKIGSSFEVWVERAGREQINALIRIYRGPVAEIELRYQILWDGIERTSFNDGVDQGIACWFLTWRVEPIAAGSRRPML